MKVEVKQPEPVKPDVVITLTGEEAQRLANLLYWYEGTDPVRAPNIGAVGSLYRHFFNAGFEHTP